MAEHFGHPFSYLSNAVRSNPDGIAVSCVETELTFTELHDSAVRIAHVLRDLGVRPGDIVGVSAQPVIDVVISQSLFHEACVGTEVPVGMAELNGWLFDWLIVVVARDDFPREKQIVVDVNFFEQVARAESTEDPRDYPDAGAMCRLNFSSGTTGAPKAIPVSIRCLEDRSIDRQHQWMLDQPYLCLLGLSTGLTFMTLIAQLRAADTFLLASTGRSAATDALAQIIRFDVRCIMGSPHQLGELLTAAQKSGESFESVTTIMSAGSVMPDFIVDQLLRRFPNARFVSTYASSEAGSVAVREGIGSADALAGTLLDDVEVIIVDDQGNPVALGEVGHIGVKRAHQPQTYLNDSEASARTFRDGFFFSGDMGYLDGRDLYLAGRASEIINAAGVKVDPARVESVVFAFDGVRDAAVFPIETTQGLTNIALVFVADTELDGAALLAYMREQLGESAPRYVARVPQITRNHMGKVNRDDLAQNFAAHVARGTSII
jgi:acyl-CoA synthetase (AMP-forming)/AMP-acid ligase II